MAELVIFGPATSPGLRIITSRMTVPSRSRLSCRSRIQARRPVPGIADDRRREVTERFPPGDYEMFVALSYAKMNPVRAEKYAGMKAAGYQLVSYVSSKCSYLSLTPPGDNCFILEDNTVQPFVTIGNNVTLWSGNHIGHDATIEDHCFITSHVVVSGHVRVGPIVHRRQCDAAELDHDCARRR